jgi:pimeloyl-ACP methyl ester carboxylesterase
MIYFPPVFDSAKADELGSAAKLERWHSPTGQALGWKRLSPIQPSAGQVLILHGNAGCAIWSSHFADVIQRTAPFDVFLVEYPGYADRPGKPTERTLEQSASEALESLSAKQPLYLVGESLGTGVAAYLAGKFPHQTAGVVLLAPFNSMVDLGKYHAPVLPVRLILCDRFRSEDHLKSYHGPVAMLVGGKDPVIPEKFGKRLYDGYTGPKRLWEFPEADHGTVMDQSPEIWKQLFDFVQDASPTPTGRTQR